VSFPIPPPLALARGTGTLHPAGVPEPGFEPKFDGWRACYAGGRLWSRRGTDLSGYFPDLMPVLHDRLPDVVLDTEIVTFDPSTGRLDFLALARRLTSGRRLAALAALMPAYMVCFDLLASNGIDRRGLSLAERRAPLEDLLAGLAAPITLCPYTTSDTEAERWLDTLPAAGIQGVMIKDRAGMYPQRAAQRLWHKFKLRDTLDLAVVGVVGDLAAPTALLLARPSIDGLTPAGVTTTLPRSVAREIALELTSDPASAPHRFGWPGREPSTLPLQGVVPIVAEISADRAVDNGILRHPARLIRLRPDLSVDDL
jgi:ATP-dependent DNA ligase